LALIFVRGFAAVEKINKLFFFMTAAYEDRCWKNPRNIGEKRFGRCSGNEAETM